jgi:UDP-glucose 4-epimerase
MKVLVVGGAGYVGSHMVKLLLEQGHEPVTLDSLVTGHRDAVVGGEFFKVDLADREALARIIELRAFDAVMHFASFIQVGESVKKPGLYYRNNFINTLNLLDAMVQAGVGRFIFSSTAAIFGEPEYVPLDSSIRSARSARTACRSRWWNGYCGTTTAHTGSSRFACATSTQPAPTPTARSASGTSRRRT